MRIDAVWKEVALDGWADAAARELIAQTCDSGERSALATPGSLESRRGGNGGSELRAA